MTEPKQKALEWLEKRYISHRANVENGSAGEGYPEIFEILDTIKAALTADKITQSGWRPPENRRPYTIDLETEPCRCCKKGAQYCVLDAHGVALGTFFADKEDAEDLADMLNDAYEAALPEPPK